MLLFSPEDERMSKAAVLEAVPVDEPSNEHLEAAARLLEQAVKVGKANPDVAYMLALCYKRLGKVAEARTALRKIATPDAQVLLQLGLLSFAEKQFAQAEQEFAKAWQLDPRSYEAAYNLMLSQLCQGRSEACLGLVVQMKPLARNEEERLFLGLLEPLLQRSQLAKGGKPPPLPTAAANGAPVQDALAAMSAADEKRLLDLMLGLGQIEAVYPLLRALAHARPTSALAQEAYAAGVLVQAKKYVERCQWDAAERLLVPLAQSFTVGNVTNVPKPLQVAAYNLIGCCECMLQEFDRGINYFTWALKLAASDPWLHQNRALAYELKGQIDQADSDWNRYFDLLDRRVPTPAVPNYREALAFEGLNRLADSFSKKERWNTALTYLQRACRLRPQDTEALERLFHTYNQVKRPEDARRTLKRLRELRPNDPQLELYELDLRDVKTLDDIEHMLSDIRKALNKYPNDTRVEEKAVSLVANVIPLIGRMSEQYTDQLNRVVEQVRRLPNYQINWTAVHDVMRDLQREFQKLRRIASKCMSLVTSEEHRRVIRDLTDLIDRKIEVCQSMGA
jgi:tetratricopeptide (TPR) repeat protein